ncbi:MAG: FAD-dependent monooxygenase [Flavobacteriaceae bacterium]
MTTPEHRRIVVAGGGIAGLSAAIFAARAGFSPHVLEQAPAIREFGAGLQLTPNAGKALAAAGLEDEVAAAAFEPRHLTILDAASGRELRQLPLGRHFAERYGAPYRVVHRPALIAVLEKAVRASTDIALELDTRVDAIAPHARGVTVMAATGRAIREIVAGGLVGADGLRSTVRQWLVGDGDPRPAGYVAWRGMADPDAFDDPRQKTGVCLWLSGAYHVVAYPLGPAGKVNIVAVTKDAWTGDDWNAPGDRTEITRRFEAAPAPLRALIAAGAGWRRWSLADRPPLARWGEGAVTLAGDAAHPALPFAGQGAAMALEDAAVLGAALRQKGAIEPAFRAYEARRRKRTRDVWALSRRNASIYHARGPLALARDIGMNLLSPDTVLDRQWWVYDWRP